MPTTYQAVIGLEIHAVIETKTKLFCGCPLLDPLSSEANSAVCPVCAGMPGSLPVLNARVVAQAVRVASALHCNIASTSVFARKSYFYPDIPKGYQISQYEKPLAVNGWLPIESPEGEQRVKISRVHIEEDTGRLSHHKEMQGEAYSLVDLNRAGVPLLEIVSEPVLHNARDARAYAFGLRSLLRYLGVNSGDLEKGLFRIEPNISLRPTGSQQFGTRVEIKNLNSFRALERGINYEIKRQTELLSAGEAVEQQTRGWNETLQITQAQRSKEDAQDYRYFPEPDLPPLVLEPEWLAQQCQTVPELPYDRYMRFQKEYQLSTYDAEVLTAEKFTADYFEDTLKAANTVSPKKVSNWLTGELFALLNQQELAMETIALPPQELAALIVLVEEGKINPATGRYVLTKMLNGEPNPQQIVSKYQLSQISNEASIEAWVNTVIAENQNLMADYLAGKESIARWLFGQVMQKAAGRANPQVVNAVLNRCLEEAQERAQSAGESEEYP